METLLPTFILTLVIMGLVFAGMGIRILLVKNGEFKGTCASNSPYLNKDGDDCPMCGKKAEEACPKS